VRGRPKPPPIGPVPGQHVDPLQVVQAKILVAHDRMRDAELAGNDAAVVVARKRVDDLFEERARLVGGQS
jgi:hypothetical protein